ncbi:ATP--guanido phosphotransferase [Leptospira adleri]|uniref:ATP--guanido phosphotransferase n=1 Tax=Leptospira adleri TaxID=2023186 RepID=A0A2M9YSJ5_9LEPT|nr:ATP--guanido phosphotransferase [Leptospira adleri]PJZ54506.1 ATP--guanido phosphotransferase [Leptospira adleri]PJZ61154.1 ATP--guanido phosphotransferase [Leptospira adleri]
MSSETCLYCGTDRSAWNELGKIGCIHCLKLFRKEYRAHLRDEKIDFSSRYLKGAESEKFARFESFSESEKIQELDQIAPPFTFRFRISRNLSGRIYPVISGVPTQILKKFLLERMEVDPAFLQSKDLPTKIPWGEGNLFSGDEDHIRWEILSSSVGEMFRRMENSPLEKMENQKFFDYDEELGYVTSCPTNAGLGTKISLKFSTKLWKKEGVPTFKVPGFLEFYLENSSEFAVFYLKNFAYSQKNSFLNLVYYLALQVEPGF